MTDTVAGAAQKLPLLLDLDSTRVTSELLRESTRQLMGKQPLNELDALQRPLKSENRTGVASRRTSSLLLIQDPGFVPDSASMQSLPVLPFHHCQPGAAIVHPVIEWLLRLADRKSSVR